jgi:hypothetical protein
MLFGPDPETFVAWLKASMTYFAVVLVVYLGWRKAIGAHLTAMRSLIPSRRQDRAAPQPA